MIEHLRLINYSSQILQLNELDLSQLQQAFCLQTCQRTLILEFQPIHNARITNNLPKADCILEGTKAYQYALEVICGLRGKMQGENEIVGQFKKSYRQYLQQSSRKAELIRILEKLLKDNKEVRTNYLKGLKFKTYANMAKTLQKSEIKQCNKVLILGSGQLAIDLIHQFNSNHEIYLSARNPEKVAHLVEKYNIRPLDWINYPKYQNFKTILCAIGTQNVLFKDHFISNWKQYHQNENLFIDFGQPSSLETSFSTQEGIYKLPDIFELANQLHAANDLKIQKALAAIKDLGQKRSRLFQEKQRCYHESDKRKVMHFGPQQYNVKC